MQVSFADIKSEYQVKATYLCAFFKYINFNDNRKEYHIGVIGENPFRGHLKKYDGKLYNGRKIIVHLFGKDIDKAIKQKCHILYISNSEQLNQKVIIQKVDNPKILTVSDNKWFLSAGGAINLIILDKKVGWELNESLIKKKDLKVSSKILRLALKARGQ
jgi:hypothetical protein